jgi:short-subunit dehydrogenase
VAARVSGSHCAELLAQEGCRVAITSRDKANLHAAANRIKGFSFMLRI